MTDQILTMLVEMNVEIYLASRSNFGDERSISLRNITENENRTVSELNFRKKRESWKLSVAVNLRATFSTLDYRVDYRVMK